MGIRVAGLDGNASGLNLAGDLNGLAVYDQVHTGKNHVAKLYISAPALDEQVGQEQVLICPRGGQSLVHGSGVDIVFKGAGGHGCKVCNVFRLLVGQRVGEHFYRAVFNIQPDGVLISVHQSKACCAAI